MNKKYLNKIKCLDHRLVSPTVTLNCHASKYKVHKLHQRYSQPGETYRRRLGSLLLICVTFFRVPHTRTLTLGPCPRSDLITADLPCTAVTARTFQITSSRLVRAGRWCSVSWRLTVYQTEVRALCSRCVLSALPSVLIPPTRCSFPVFPLSLCLLGPLSSRVCHRRAGERKEEEEEEEKEEEG